MTQREIKLIGQYVKSTAEHHTKILDMGNEFLHQMETYGFAIVKKKCEECLENDWSGKKCESCK